MQRLCQYRNALGEPRQGIHSFRIFDIAVFDVLLTFALAYVVNLVGNVQNYWLALLYTFIVGIFMHWLFCVDTTVNRFLFPSAVVVE
jgi:fatty acid desaturase